MIVNCAAGHEQFKQLCNEAFEKDGRYIGTIKPKETIKDQQRRLIHAIYKRIANTTGESVQEVTAVCKLIFGAPIRCEDDEYNALYMLIFGDYIADYERAIKLMKSNKVLGVNGFPVTRDMTTKQAAKYIDTLKHEHYDVDFEDLD